MITYIYININYICIFTHIYTFSIQEAEELYRVMLKRFKTSKRVWCDFGWFLLASGKTEEARKLLQRSMKSLPEHKRGYFVNFLNCQISRQL